jgi:hypothetical protein
VYPDVSAKLPGVELEEDKRECQMVTIEPEPEFWDLAAAVLNNAGIDPDARMQAVHKLAMQAP